MPTFPFANTSLISSAASPSVYFFTSSRILPLLSVSTKPPTPKPPIFRRNLAIYGNLRSPVLHSFHVLDHTQKHSSFFSTSTMAPSGRPKKLRKLGISRMAIAVEHLTKDDWGFDGEVVKEVAKQLLHEYGDEEAWYFLEQDSYSLLIEKILEYQENNDHEGSSRAGNEIEDGSLQGETADEKALAVVQGPSGVDAEEISQGETGVDDDVLAIEEAEVADKLLTIEGVKGNETGLTVSSPVSSKSAIARRRLPCYGWIDGDEGGEPDDFILLTPAVQVSRVSPIASMESLEKRRSLWHMRPEDP